MPERRFWDLFYAGHWVGMAAGADMAEAEAMVARSLPSIKDSVLYAEWFGRKDPRNCQTSGGMVPDPMPTRSIFA